MNLVLTGSNCFTITPLGLLLTIVNALHILRWGGAHDKGAPCHLLFAIAIEPLAEAIRSHPDIHVITINQKQHNISLYADYMLLFITQPKISIPSVLDVINTFSEFSGYIIHFTKSEAMPLGSGAPCSTPWLITLPMGNTRVCLLRYICHSCASNNV